jgi:hypothetical protein
MVRVYGKQELLRQVSLGVIGSAWLKSLEMQNAASLFGMRLTKKQVSGSHR